MYRGRAAGLLAGIEIGDTITVTRGSKKFSGILMPRNELADDEHLVLKLSNGYNIGIRIDRDTQVRLLDKGIRPKEVSEELDKLNPDLPSITILGTGGTIASKIDYKTGAVAPAFSARELHLAIPELSRVANIKTRMLFNILSENMTPENWQTTAIAAAEELNKGADGVVIAHGTDTLGYTSAALSFMLKDLCKPVVLVGSQRSSDRPSSDSAMNLLCAAKVAVSDAAGVFVVMHGTLSDDVCNVHLGTKVRKMHSSRRDAFHSVNALPIGRVAEGVEFSSEINRRKEGKVRVEKRLDPKVILLKIYPGIGEEILNFCIDRYNGVVFEGTGLGHIPEGLLRPLDKAKKEGIPVVMTTQTLYGRVDMKVYSTGRRLLELGVIPGGDMLPETALVKLMHVLGQTKNSEEIRKMMETNIAGELSETSRPDTFLR